MNYQMMPRSADSYSSSDKDLANYPQVIHKNYSQGFRPCLPVSGSLV
jgi:hypothetical protein